jgi:molecular chaperone GrpE
MTDSEAQDHLVSAQESPVGYDREERARVRERIVRRFELWLDEILDGEPPIQGIAAEILEQLEAEGPIEEPRQAEAGCDLFTVWSAVTAMTEETRLQGRAFKQLHDGMSPLQGLVGSGGAMLERYQAALDLQQQKTHDDWTRAVWKEVLDMLIDMRDRLMRGADSAQAWLDRPEPARQLGFAQRVREKIFPLQPDVRIEQRDEAVRSLLKGYTLCREVLDEALERVGVRPMDCVGKPFDPQAMKAVDTGREANVPEGTVLEVYRRGYRWNEEVYRQAEVKVAAAGSMPRQEQVAPERNSVPGGVRITERSAGGDHSANATPASVNSQ